MTMKWMQGIKKIAAALLLALVFATSMVTSAHAEESASTAAEHIVLTVDSADMRVDGEDVSIADGVPVLNGGRVYVPLRAVAETFGAEVNYDGVTGDVTITTAENEVIMNTLASVYTVNGWTWRRISTAPAAPWCRCVLYPMGSGMRWTPARMKMAQQPSLSPAALNSRTKMTE